MDSVFSLLIWDVGMGVLVFPQQLDMTLKLKVKCRPGGGVGLGARTVRVDEIIQGKSSTLSHVWEF